MTISSGDLAGSAALACVALPAVAAALGLLLGTRWRSLAADFAVVGALAALAAAGTQLWAVLRGGPVQDVPFLGSARTGEVVVGLTLRADELSALTAVAVTVVALCVQVYSVAYLGAPDTASDTPSETPQAPTRYPAYAATVSLFTSAMLLVVHADDLLLLLVGWEVMGLASYLLVGHHSERPAARAAAVKAFLTTRAGDVGLLLAVVVLIAGAGTTSITELLDRVQAGQVGPATMSTAAVLALAGVVGKSAQFPLHTWLPDAMEGPTPVSALIHAATMVAAGVYLVIRLFPLYLEVPAALEVAAVLASVTMLGAALAAFAQDDLKRLLAYSTISQVAFMLAAVAVGDPAAGLFHLLSHAAFKALLFLAAGCVVHVVGSTLLADMGGLLRTHRALAVLYGIGLAALAGLPPFAGFWSKESVLTAAEHAAQDGEWTGWLVLLTGLTTTLVTGLYAGRAWAVVALAPVPLAAEQGGHPLPRAMTVPLFVLAVPSVLLGLLLVRPPAALDGIGIGLFTGYSATVLALAGVGWAVTGARLGAPDVAAALPARVRLLLLQGFRVEAAQRLLIVRPVQALAVAVRVGDRAGIDAVVRAIPAAAGLAGSGLRRGSTGLATGYLVWVVAGAVVAGAVGVAGAAGVVLR